MNDQSITSVAQLSDLIKAAASLGIDRVERKDDVDEVYKWMTNLLVRLRYRCLKKKERGIVRRYLVLYSGYTESHVNHLISAYQKRGTIEKKKRTQPEFATVYTIEDIALLAEVADAYQHQNGKALKETMREMYDVYDDIRFERLRHLSVSRLYDLKKTELFKTRALHYTKTRATTIPIGERRKPYPEGKPGYLRVDSVHQGDRDKEKGVYHIHLVDEVTQWDIVVCVEGISEHFLLSALEEALEQFPFTILNFHSDNGSEYINKVVARLLEKLRIRQTKSRARRTNDNALVEGKNAAVVRKYMGYVHIPKKHASAISVFYKTFFNPFVNYHRFCAFPDEEISAKGKIVKKYRTYLTPCGKLLSLQNVDQYLKEGKTRSSLTATAKKQSHFVAAQEMRKEKQKLFDSFSTRRVL